MKKSAQLLLAVIVCLAGAISCSHSHAEFAEIDPRIVVGITGGEISRTSPVYVQFANPVGEEAGTALVSSPFSFSPHIRGEAYWRDPYTIEFVPAAEFVPKTSYAVTFTPPSDILPGQKPFRFSFYTPPKVMSLDHAVLSIPDAASPDVMELSGTVRLSDLEDPKDVEKSLSAVVSGKKVNVKVMDDQPGKVFAWVVGDIVKQSKPQNLRMELKGFALESPVDNLRYKIPSSDSFEVLAVFPRKDEETRIDIVFSQPLSGEQDFKGLVNVEEIANLRIVRRTNTLSLYSAGDWPGRVYVNLDENIKSQSGARLAQAGRVNVAFPTNNPQARFVGDGVVIPTSQGTTVAIETMNLSHIMVEAVQIYGSNIHQFLQVNRLDGNEDLHRVGAIAWRKVIDLGWKDSNADVWQRYGLDISPLLKKDPSGIFQLRITFRRPHVRYRDMNPDSYSGDSLEWASWPDGPVQEADSSSWDYWENNGNYNERRNRNNPTYEAYYKSWSDHDITVKRNVMFSDIGLISRTDDAGNWYFWAANLKTTEPMAGIPLKVYNYQQKQLAAPVTNRSGMAVAKLGSQRPFFLVASNGPQSGYLRLDAGSALASSHFDISGVTRTDGVDGFIYGERDVWRPGDTMYLTLVLHDPRNTIPQNHPLVFKLFDPRGNIVEEHTLSGSVNGFYSHTATTRDDAPTGVYTARFILGGRSFDKNLRVESVMPNRLKIELDFPGDDPYLVNGALSMRLKSRWLHGAKASSLKARIGASFLSIPTVFSTFSDYIFNDPSRQYHAGSQEIFTGTLDENGEADISGNISIDKAPGKLSATFTTRVFEPGGAFSIEYVNRDFHPFERYVGLKTPRGDVARGMLLTDTDHPVDIVMVDRNGQRLPGNTTVKAELFKLQWRWWWETNEENVAQYFSSHRYSSISSGTVSLVNGQGTWKMRVNYPDWGRYFVKITDESGGHSAGKIIYIDWPGWAGRAQDDGAGGAAMLVLSPEKHSYTVGEQAVVTMPSSQGGRVLVTLESNGTVLSSEWIPTANETSRYTFRVTREMAPNVYVHATQVQPHLQTANDRPVRTYGIVPVMVVDPLTQLVPRIDTASVYRPGEPFIVSVSEESGRPMTYTLAVVDEGLLGITRYSAPDPGNQFYKKLSSRLRYWDLYNYVAGAYSGRLGTLLAIGGGDEGDGSGKKKANRFTPVVLWSGPVSIASGETKIHHFEMPQYVGAVRVMVVAGHAKAYGKAEKEVPVKKDLMVLGTLPRVMGPGETLDFPVDIFVMNPDLRGASVSVRTEGPVSVAGNTAVYTRFSGEGEYQQVFRLQTAKSTGPCRVSIMAESGNLKAEQTINIMVRPPQEPVTKTESAFVRPGESHTAQLSFTGIPGSNRLKVEASGIPSMDLSRRLGYLITYPHGCIEQTTSSVFPQLFLDKLVQLTSSEAASQQKNIEAAIERFKSFQTNSGGFSYWPGESSVNEWGTNYAGHFLLEAESRGYPLPPYMKEKWLEHQQNEANAWFSRSNQDNLTQAYRLYLMALAGKPDLGAMNRLSEKSGLGEQARWRLAMAYSIMGRSREASNLVSGLSGRIEPYNEMSGTFGSDLRDKGMILESLSALNYMTNAAELATEISKALSSEKSYGTQTTAYALLGMFKFGLSQSGRASVIRLAYSVRDGRSGNILVTTPAVYQEIPMDSYAPRERVTVTNQSQIPLIVNIVTEGIPEPGKEEAEKSNLDMSVTYTDMDGKTINPGKLAHGDDFRIRITVKNPQRNRNYQNLALSFVTPPGWEIHNSRLMGTSSGNRYTYMDIRDDRVYTYFDLSSGESREYVFFCNAAYKGRFYHPLLICEAMYDGTVRNIIKGFWTTVE